VDVLIKILPVYLLFLAGIVLKLLKIIKKENAEFLLKLVFYFTLPALIIRSLSSVPLDFKVSLMPLISALIILITYFFSLIYVKINKLPAEKAGVLFAGTMILNIGFIIPFVHSVYGDYGLSRLLLFDFSNGFLAYSVVYAIAVRHGNKDNNLKSVWKKLLFSPPLWALMIALFLNIFHLQIPVNIVPFLEISGNLTIPLLLIAIGVFFEPQLTQFRNLAAAVFIRMILGLLLGFIFVKIFQLEGINKLIVLAGASAPAGFNTLTFATLENLDKKFAAVFVSVSILIAMIWIPILILLMK